MDNSLHIWYCTLPFPRLWTWQLHTVVKQTWDLQDCQFVLLIQNIQSQLLLKWGVPELMAVLHYVRTPFVKSWRQTKCSISLLTQHFKNVIWKVSWSHQLIGSKETDDSFHDVSRHNEKLSSCGLYPTPLHPAVKQPSTQEVGAWGATPHTTRDNAWRLFIFQERKESFEDGNSTICVDNY